jgi:hypothetical protein
MSAPSDSRVETALAGPAPKPPRPPCPGDDSRPAEARGGEPAGPRRDSFLTALLRALAPWPT